jgi:predicted dehydrogenase
MPERYRVGVIGRTGRGNYGHGHDEVWRDVPRTQVVAVADDDPDGLARTAKKIGAPAAYADYREMLDRERLDVVSVAPRWLDCHAELVLAAVEHGCHVWMEKPFCRNLAEADAIVRAVEMRHAKLAIAHQTRWTPTLDAVTRAIKDGLIGRVLELRGRGKEDARRGGGEDLWVLGSHILDLMRVFAGDPRTCFATVTQQGQPITATDVAEGAEGIGPLAGDAVDATFAFSGGVKGYFSSRRGAGSGDTRFGLQVCGSEGIIEITTGHLGPCHVLQDPLWSPGRSGKEWTPITSSGVGQPETLTNPGLHGGNVLGVNDLLDCIEDPARQPRCNVYDGRWTVEMIAAVFESQRAGGPVSLPLAERRNPLALLRGEGSGARS